MRGISKYDAIRIQLEERDRVAKSPHGGEHPWITTPKKRKHQERARQQEEQGREARKKEQGARARRAQAQQEARKVQQKSAGGWQRAHWRGCGKCGHGHVPQKLPEKQCDLKVSRPEDPLQSDG